MDNKLPCEIIRDLLPSYVDELTSEVTNKAIENHIRECDSCASMLDRMREPEEREQPQAAEIDYLKKTRKRFGRNSMLWAIAAVIVVAFGFLIRFYYIGSEVSASVLNYDVSVQDNTIAFNGNLIDSGSGYSRLSFKEEEGIVTIKVYTSPKTFFNDRGFSSNYTAEEEIKEVRIGNMVIWDNGGEISRATASLYAAKNPYVGDMGGNSEVAAALGISDKIGGFLNELQTDREPYGWKLVLSDRIASEKEGALREAMTVNSYAILAVIDNLGYVTWEYKTDAGIETLTITEEEATSYLGRDVKECAETPADLQGLMEGLRLD